MAEKSFFANLLDFIIKGSKKIEGKNISAQQALLLQKDFVDNLSRKKADISSPPYAEIAKQLSSEKSEIFRAAVYYLIKISDNEPRYFSPILSILQNYAKKAKRSDEDMEFLKTHLKNLTEAKD